MTIGETVGRRRRGGSVEAPASSSTTEHSLAQALAAVLSRARNARRGRPTVASLVGPMPSVDPIDLVAAASRRGLESRLWLRPADGFALAGIGTAWSIRPEGPESFSTVDQAWRELIAGCVVDSTIGAPSVTGPLLVGGFPFRPVRHAPSPRPAASDVDAGGRADVRAVAAGVGAQADPGAHADADAQRGTDAWRGFETASMELPRFLVTLIGGLAWLTITVVVGEDGTTPGAIADEWSRIVSDVTPVPWTRPEERLTTTTPIAEADWQATVARLAGAVGRGRMDKVVLARQVDVRADRDFDVPAILRRLESSAPESTIFAVTRSGRTFLGATPERLAWVAGESFATVALAGSAPRGTDHDADGRLAAALLASEKEREEHKVVVDELRSALTPLAASIDIPAEPRIVALRHVQHLETPIKGTLRDPLGVLALVEALHPTPAVGGAPRALALELIDEQEKLDRGWYAGPLGWVGPDGDGEFVVAIRSGVIDGSKATLFAGCGIVADSDPSREWEESQVKLRALASALGTLPMIEEPPG